MFSLFLSLLLFIYPYASGIPAMHSTNEHVLSSHSFSLADRYANKQVNEVFKDNIALNFAYLSNRVKTRGSINWNDILSSQSFEFSLKPGEVFAFHNDTLPQYKNAIVKTTNANFNIQDGFKSDGYLVGDGVCHFASLINWAASDANLESTAPTNHNFAVIPEVPSKYGVAIYKDPNTPSLNAMQNLYIKNNKTKLITFRFNLENDKLKVSIVEKGVK